MPIYAIIETGGKQYRVTPGQKLDVDLLGVADGAAVELDRVLMIADGDNITMGKPAIEGARVTATVLAEVKGDKVVAIRYKAKVRSHKKTGHRQRFTRILIGDILAQGTTPAKPARKRSTKKKEATEVTADGS